ncbi:MAG: hypothetical protein ACPG4Y_09335, partial [Chitinophagales bacterium]
IKNRHCEGGTTAAIFCQLLKWCSRPTDYFSRSGVLVMTVINFNSCSKYLCSLRTVIAKEAQLRQSFVNYQNGVPDKQITSNAWEFL